MRIVLPALAAWLFCSPVSSWTHGDGSTTFDPNHKDAGIVLSGGNLVATASSGGAVRSTHAVADGRQGTVTFTLTITSGITAVGLVNPSYVFSDNALGADANSIGFYNNGNIVRNGMVLAVGDPFNDGDTVQIFFTRQGGSLATFYGVPIDPCSPSDPSIDLSSWGSGPIYGAAQLANSGDSWLSDWTSWNVP